jgi:putative restriction endonuclease
MASKNLWTRDELLAVLNLYLSIPFGQMYKTKPIVIEYAKLIGREPSAVAMRLGNYASVDPYHQQRGIKGLQNGKRQVQPIWNEFEGDKEAVIFESELVLAKYRHTTVEDLNDISEDELPREGRVREQIVKVRVNQKFFRKSILTSYNNQCCITGISQPELLVAGHIRPWGIDIENRLNPRNGLAMNALHDKAFEAGHLTITPDYTILISSTLLKQESAAYFFVKYHQQKMILPTKYLPDNDFLLYHNRERFKG